MNPSQIPEKPLVALVNKNVPASQKIFYFEKENGTIFHTEERDAWTILKGRNQVIGRRPERIKLVGVSDGVIYREEVSKANQVLAEKGIEAAQVYLRKAMDEDLERARGKVEMPRNFDTLDDRGNPVNLNLLR